jgi:hypothetical protein
MKVALDVAVVLALVVIEAVFVATEIALISLRDSQVRGLATKGRRGAAVARLTADPNRFLAGVQIGVTLTSLLSSAYGAVTLSASAASGLEGLGMTHRWAVIVGFLASDVVDFLRDARARRTGPEAAGIAARRTSCSTRGADPRPVREPHAPGHLVAIDLDQCLRQTARGRPRRAPPVDQRRGAARSCRDPRVAGP